MNDLHIVKCVFFLLFVLNISSFPVHLESSESKAVLVSNNLAEFNAAQGKLKLTLIRVWGENEEDECVQSPHQVLTSKTNDVYICDMNNHVVKVFDRDGTYLRTIGRPGRGPGDLNLPSSMALSSTGDMWVAEIGGLRVQRFSPREKPFLACPVILLFSKDLRLKRVGKYLIIKLPWKTIRLTYTKLTMPSFTRFSITRKTPWISWKESCRKN